VLSPNAERHRLTGSARTALAPLLSDRATKRGNDLPSEWRCPQRPCKTSTRDKPPGWSGHRSRQRLPSGVARYW
jgi:hypothetical protein